MLRQFSTTPASVVSSILKVAVAPTLRNFYIVLSFRGLYMTTCINSVNHLLLFVISRGKARHIHWNVIPFIFLIIMSMQKWTRTLSSCTARFKKKRKGSFPSLFATGVFSHFLSSKPCSDIYFVPGTARFKRPKIKKALKERKRNFPSIFVTLIFSHFSLSNHARICFFRLVQLKNVHRKNYFFQRPQC